MLTNIQYVCNIEGRAPKTLVFQDLLAFGFNLAAMLMEAITKYFSAILSLTQSVLLGRWDANH